MNTNPAPAPAPAPGNRAPRAPFGPRGEGRGSRPPHRGGPSRQGGRSSQGRGGRGGGRGRFDARRQGMRRPMQGGAPRPKGEYLPEAPGEKTVRVIPLGGVEEVGRNCIAVEANGDIVVFDAGFQFVSDDGGPGIDYLLPNTAYLEKNQDRVRAVVITHGHLDHIGGIPFILSRFGNPPIYTQELTAVMIKRRQEEFPDIPKPEIVTVQIGQSVTVGKTKLTFFPVTHSIPDSMGTMLATPQGNVVITGDLKLEHENGVPSEREQKTWGALSKEKNIMFIADSTNAEKDGFSIPERKVYETLEDIIKTVKGRLIIGTFASQFERMVHIIKAAEKYGKKVVTEGRSIRTNIEIAQRVGLLKENDGVIIPAQEVDNYPPDKIVILSTGAQGEEFGALTRIATGQHKFLRFTSRDTVVLSSSVIPGNEVSVQRLKDNLYRHDLTIIHYRSSDVHSTGHGNTGELVWMNQMVNAKYFMPGYGYHTMLRCHARAVEQAGRPRETIIIPDNGTVIDIEDGEKLNVHKEKVPSAPLVVDGFMIGDMQEVVVRDRQMLAKDGMFVIIATIHLKTGKLKKSPDIISRGFIYLRESQELLNQARLLIKKTVEDTTQGMNPVDLDFVKDRLTDTVSGFLFSRTNKAPMVIPVLIGV